MFEGLRFYTEITDHDFCHVEIAKDVFGFTNSGDDEFKRCCHYVRAAFHLIKTNNFDTLLSVYRQGTSDDGDVPSKGERDWLVNGGYLVRISGENLWAVACTYEGANVAKVFSNEAFRKMNNLKVGNE
jgi:hypothetical protein